jgi:hypothetical protein
LESSKLDGQWGNILLGGKWKVLVLGGPWKVPMFGGLWKVPSLIAFERKRRNIFFTFPQQILLKHFFH